MIKTFFILFSLSLVSSAYSLDPNYLANNKESASKVIKKKDERLVNGWLISHGSREATLDRAKDILASALKKIEKQDAYCDIGFSSLLKQEARDEGLIRFDSQFPIFLSFLRIENVIDDILFSNLLKSDELGQELESANSRRFVVAPINRYNDETSEIDVEKLYEPFKTWPDEMESCSVTSYHRMTLSLPWKNKRDRNGLLSRLNYIALEKGIISRDVYTKLELIKDKDALDWNSYISGYFDIIAHAKDKLSPTGKPENDPSSYSNEYVKRKERLTQRGRLYRVYDSTQIMMLADIIQKTARRMDAHYVAINFQFDNTPDSEIETYVLSPMERYRLSIKMLRKDMAELMRSELFKNKSVEYEDIVTAAYETGLIKSNELELILKFEEFWNPKQEKWRTYTSFAFSILGTASFYLPPPWNIVGALALVVTETQIDKKEEKPDADDNWNVVI